MAMTAVQEGVPLNEYNPASPELTYEEAPDDLEDVEFDENDKKIISLYEIINEMIEEQKARTHDLYLLASGTDSQEMINIVETRNDNLLKQVFNELDLNRKEEDDDDDEEEDSEDETDEGWDIYNAVVKNLNEYMESIAEFVASLNEQKELLEHYTGPQEEEIQELEQVIEEQTGALQAQMNRNDELEGALQSVLTEYSKRISSSNDEIQVLHRQLQDQTKQHQIQTAEVRQMYESKINELTNAKSEAFKDELAKLLETLSVSRENFQEQISELSTQMVGNEQTHNKEVISLKETISELQTQVTLYEEQEDNKAENIIDSLKLIRTPIDIDEEDLNTAAPTQSSYIKSQPSAASSKYFRNAPQKPLPSGGDSSHHHSKYAPQTNTHLQTSAAKTPTNTSKYYTAQSSRDRSTAKPTTQYGTNAFDTGGSALNPRSQRKQETLSKMRNVGKTDNFGTGTTSSHHTSQYHHAQPQQQTVGNSNSGYASRSNRGVASHTHTHGTGATGGGYAHTSHTQTKQAPISTHVSKATPQNTANSKQHQQVSKGMAKYRQIQRAKYKK